MTWRSIHDNPEELRKALFRAQADADAAEKKWDAAEARIAELEALLRDAAPFLEASEAVWRELERLRREAGKPMGLESSTELRIREREAWIDYDEQRCGPRLRAALSRLDTEGMTT